MGEKNTEEVKKHISVGLVAHVDAGKTTLSENILYHCNAIKAMGRVDHGDTFLDTNPMERKRGITIYSKEAVFNLGDKRVYLLDTPGHVDFSAEMERCLQVLDYAVLVINGADGVQSHTATLWKLLEIYNVPVFIFVNKMDQAGTDRELLIRDLIKLCGDGVIDFATLNQGDTMENIAVTGEDTLDYFMEHGDIRKEHIVDAICSRKIFPCYFGSALKDTGVEEFISGIDIYTKEKQYGEKFSARVFKIARDSSGARLTYMKITGGSIGVKSLIDGGEQSQWQEKIEQIRIYSGDKFEAIKEAEAGMVCAVTGLTKTFSGELLGTNTEGQNTTPILEPVLRYKIIFPQGTDIHSMVKNLKQLQEEDPLLQIYWNEKSGEIHANVMGAIQIEILKSIILERYNIEAEFDSGSIVYKETITDVVEGVGHFEPLRHYAEVHLIMEPLESGSGLVFRSKCSEDMLNKNWQKLILTHLGEKEHIGVLTGSPITDMKITLTGGRAHKKHTEGGDFRQATYRAVRQGLKEATSILLEPYYSFRLEVPSEMVGRAMSDIQKMSGSFENPENDGEVGVITGKCPVVTMADYSTEVLSYTRGRGKLYCSLKGYEPCHNQEEVIENIAYDWMEDMDNPTGSMFCTHGAGFYVPWDKVKEYMHVEETLKGTKESVSPQTKKQSREAEKDFFVAQKELEEIFERTYGRTTNKVQRSSYKKTVNFSEENSDSAYTYKGHRESQDEYLLVDGYNIIFSWEELSEIAKVNLDGARMRLQDILCNYQGFKKCNLIVVFDAYKVENNKGSVEKYNNIDVVYTKEAETADQYIEKTVHQIGKKYRVTVATSDRLEQMIIMGDGASRMSAEQFFVEVKTVNETIRNYLTNN